jgi:hypothetical protein
MQVHGLIAMGVVWSTSGGCQPKYNYIKGGAKASGRALFQGAAARDSRVDFYSHTLRIYSVSVTSTVHHDQSSGCVYDFLGAGLRYLYVTNFSQVAADARDLIRPRLRSREFHHFDFLMLHFIRLTRQIWQTSTSRRLKLLYCITTARWALLGRR